MGVTITGGDVVITSDNGNLQVNTQTTFNGAVAQPLGLQTTVLPTGASTVSSPGFYYISGSTSTTASIPAAGSSPGARMIFTEAAGSNFCLTGSSWASGKAIFVLPSFASGTAAKHGTRLNSGNGASVALESDGFYWLVLGGTGSLTLAGGVL